MSTKVLRIETFRSEFAQYGTVIFDDLDNNTPTTVSEIAVRTGIQEAIVRRAMYALESQSVAVREPDENGIECWFCARRLSMAVFQLFSAGRTWVSEKDGSSIEQLATDLSIHYGVAKRLAEFLQVEGIAKLVVE